MRSSTIQPDGKSIIAGDFMRYNGTPRNRIARLNSDGLLDASFDPGWGANDRVGCSAVQPDGKIVLCGAFTGFNGAARNRITRLNSNGSLDASFNPGSGANNQILSLALQTDGKILIGGIFTSYNGTARNRIARLNTDGSLDASFLPGSGTNVVYAITIQPDGKILIGGSFTSYNGTVRNRIARLNTDGSLDTSFDPVSGADATVYAVTVQPDGKILIGGDFATYDGAGRNRIARLYSNGALDTSFDPGASANSSVRSISYQPDGRIIIGGDFWNFNNVMRLRLARVNSNGSLDDSFDPGSSGNPYVLSTTIQGDGKILVCGGGNLTANTARDATAAAELIDITGPLPRVQATAPMPQALQWHTATVLADGKVAVTGGALQNNQLVGVSSTAYLWDPATGTWTADASTLSGRARLYHSTALLLPDASVLVAGGGAPGPQTNTNAEIYYPPYLFTATGELAARPAIVQAPSELRPGTSIAVQVDNGAAIRRVTLIKTGSVTHSFNMDQRFIPLLFTRSSSTDDLSVAPPANLNTAPPGYYLLFAIDADASLAELGQLASEHNRSTYPVYEEDLDHIIGVAHVKDLVRVQHASRRVATIRGMMREALFVPDTIKLDKLLAQMRVKRQHLAIVLDEYGGTAGLVTLGDLLEQIVGEVHDTFDATGPELQRLPDGAYLVEGLTQIESVNERLGLKIADDYYDTIAGFMLGRLGRMAKVGDTIDLEDGLRLRVEALDGLRIARLTIQPPRPANGTAVADADRVGPSGP